MADRNGNGATNRLGETGFAPDDGLDGGSAVGHGRASVRCGSRGDAGRQILFAPAGANFTGVRSFALEVRHAATANFVIYSAILGQDPPAGVTVDGAANGPASLQTKEQIVQYLKDSFTLGHQALATLNNGNALAPLDKLPIAIPSLNTRLALAIFSLCHASDHYGQMVEYLRMNGIVPPASVGQPPANPPA